MVYRFAAGLRTQSPPKYQFIAQKARHFRDGLSMYNYRTYSMTTRRLGSVPVEWVVMFSISCRAAWIT